MKECERKCEVSERKRGREREADKNESESGK